MDNTDEIIEENLIYDYDSSKWNNYELQRMYLYKSREIIKLENGNKLEYTFYDDKYKLTSKSKASFVREDLYNSEGVLINRSSIDYTDKH